MNVISGNIFDFYNSVYALIIPVNGSTRTDGSAILEGHIAQTMVSYFHDFPWRLGDKISLSGNQVFFYEDINIYTFPTKTEWHRKSELKIIERSCIELSKDQEYIDGKPILMPKVGCDRDDLNWDEVRPIIEKYLPDALIIVSY